jgi:BirA family transcriptional regulator, biotin operon repressor / biotin---[acetyl-CoA-carboxylase] ligase
VTDGTSNTRLHEWEELYHRTGVSLDLLHCYTETGSTMDTARALLPLVPLNGVGLVFTRTQTAGRGRRGREWRAPPLGFYGTFIFRRPLSPHRFAGFSLATGVALTRYLSSIGVLAALKWPNDLLSYSGEKFGGILIELVAEEGSTSILTGIGLNLSGIPSGVEYPASSMEAICGVAHHPAEVAAGISRFLVPAEAHFASEGFAAFRSEWCQRALWLRERIRLTAGAGLVEGTFVGVSESGSIQIRTGRGLEEFGAGEITL